MHLPRHFPGHSHAVGPGIMPIGRATQASGRFPYKALRTTGFLQMSLGLVAFVFQVIDIVVAGNLKQAFMDDLRENRNTDHYNFYPYGVNVYDWSTRNPYNQDFYYTGYHIFEEDKEYPVTYSEHMYYQGFHVSYIGTGIWTGLLIILVGAFGLSMSPERQNYRVCLRNTYLVLSIIVAVVVVPVLFSLSSVVFILSAFHGGKSRLLSPVVLMVSALAEFILAIVSASICCCCARVSSNQITVVGVSPQPPLMPMTTLAAPQPGVGVPIHPSTQPAGVGYPQDHPVAPARVPSPVYLPQHLHETPPAPVLY